MIRQFLAEDADACCALIRACIEYDLEMPPALRGELLGSETPAAMRERGNLFYIAVYEMDGNVAGLGGLDMNEIRLLYVSPSHQRSGIGSAILENLEGMVPPALFQDVFVYAARSAAGFYTSRGYASRGEHCFEVGSQKLPTVFMAKLLKASK